MKKGIYPGTFDPFTNGHMLIVEQAVDLFEEVIISIAVNTEKVRKISADKMKTAIEETLKIHNISNAKVIIDHGLTVRLAEKEGAKYLIRGLRNGTDYEYEENLAQINEEISNVKTIYFRAGKLSYLSSSAVMGINKFDDTEDIISSWLPSPIFELVSQR